MHRLPFVAALLLAGLSAPSHAQTYGLPEIGVGTSGTSRSLAVRNRATGTMQPLGALEAGGFRSTPNTLTLPDNDNGSTGNVSGMSVLPNASAAPGTTAWLLAYLSGTTTVAALRTTSRAGFFSRATTLGYLAAGDGGGASYRYDPTDATTADDGCGTIVGPGGIRWKIEATAGLLDLRQCGAKGDDSDETARIQAAVNHASLNGLRILVPARTFRTTAPVTVYPDKPVQIVGQGVNPGDLSGTRGPGSWFHLAHLGIGFNLSGTGYAGENELIGIGTYRDQPVPSSSSFAPIAADYDVVLNAAQGVIDMTMLNPTKGLRIANNVGHRVWVKRLRGQFLQVGVLGEQANDKAKIDYLDAWPYWYNNSFANAYTAANLDVFYSQRMDGLHGGYLFAINARSALRYGKNASGAPGVGLGVSSEHHWDGVYADGTRHLISTDADARYTNTHIGWATHFQDSQGTGADYGIQDQGAPDVAFTVDSLKSNNLRGGFAYMAGPRSRLMIGAFTEGTFNRAGGSTGFVAVSGSQVQIGQYQRANANSTVYGTNPIPGGPAFTAPNGGAARAAGSVFAMLDRGSTSGTTDANGLVTFSHSAGMTPTDVRVFPAFPAGSFRLISVSATAVTIKVSNTTDGALIGAGVSIPVSYELGVAGVSAATGAYP